MTGQQLFSNDNTAGPIKWAHLPDTSRALCEIVAAAVTAGRDVDSVDLVVPNTAEVVWIRGLSLPEALAAVQRGVASIAERSA